MNQPRRTASRVATIAIVVIGAAALAVRRRGDLDVGAVRKPPKHALHRTVRCRTELVYFATRPQDSPVCRKTGGKHRKSRSRTAT